MNPEGGLKSMVSPPPKRTPDEDSMPSLSSLVELSLSRHEFQTTYQSGIFSSLDGIQQSINLD